MTRSVVEETLFKRVPNGWVFAAPNPWLLGARRGYLASDAQKAELVRCVEEGRTARFLVALLALGALMGAVPLASPTLLALPSLATWIVLLGAVLAFTFCVNLADYWSVREKLAALAPTAQTIGLLDLLRRQAEATPAGMLAGVAACNALACMLLLAQWSMLQHAPFALVSALACGASALMFGAMLAVRLRAPARP